MPAGKNGNPNKITSLITFDLMSDRFILFKIIGSEKIKIMPDTRRFDIKTPSI